MFRRILHYYTEGFPKRSHFPEGLGGLYKYSVKLFMDMPPGLCRLFKFQPVFALISGFIVLFMLRRGFEHVPFVVVFVILSFIYIMLRLYFRKRNSEMINKVSDITVLFFVSDMVIFILPFYFESMTYFSRNIFFGILLLSLAIISSIYILYERIVLKSAFRYSIYYAMIFFCVLNFIFPIIFGMRNIWSIALSGSIAAVSAVSVYWQMTMQKSWKNTLKYAAGIMLSVCFMWFGRSLIPPAPLRLIYATACENVEEHVPVMPFSNAGGTLREIYFFTAVFAPNGLSERIDHVWYYNGKKLMTVNLQEIRGGRDDGYRTWSKKTALEGRGKYTVEVWTAGGQLLGEGSFFY